MTVESKVQTLEQKVRALEKKLDQVGALARQAKAETEAIRTIIEKPHPQEKK